MNRNEKFEIGNDPDLSLGTKISKLYSGSQITRALISEIPLIGTYIDNVLTDKAQSFAQRRIELYISELSAQVKELKIQSISQDDEVIFDLFQSVLDKVTKTKSSDKIKRFASLSTSCLNGECSWDETEAAINLVNELSDIQVKILKIAHQSDGYILVEKLPLVLSSLTKSSSMLFCADLVSKGLLKDQGVSHLDAGAIEMLSSTELNDWFLKRVHSMSLSET
ncbi:hypothetical protein NB499_15025 [Vibrio alginolyticus]|nr:hypothetical protein [Vibrio alginolyticus]MCR9614587.1 hypothetical protein [Vibrio alginolyticus]